MENNELQGSVSESINSLHDAEIILEKIIEISSAKNFSSTAFYNLASSFQPLQNKNSLNITRQFLSKYLVNIKNADPDKAVILNSFLENFLYNSDIASALFRSVLKLNSKKVLNLTLQLYLQKMGSERIRPDMQLIKTITEEITDEKSLLFADENLKLAAAIFSGAAIMAAKPVKDPLLFFFLQNDDFKLKYFASRLLDLENRKLPPETARKLLGLSEYEKLEKYLNFTCAGYSDIFSLISSGKIDDFAESVINTEKICGEKILKNVIAFSGWSRINEGIFCEKKYPAEIKNSFPFFLDETEAFFLQQCLNADIGNPLLVFELRGSVSFGFGSSDKSSQISLFKEYNLEHAEALKLILDIAPLSEEKIRAILNRMDKIVEWYIQLFENLSDECSQIKQKYDDLKSKTLNELDLCSGKGISATLTRLLQTFEDPPDIGKVTTIHGLKRYLHQKGLKLGFKLVDKTRSPNRTVDLILFGNGKIQFELKNIRYADFEPESANLNEIPYPVKILRDSFKRQILYGQKSFPLVNIFLYGNEVHYYAFFRNHPLFIRMDYSPPLQGGMIDLEYFGISNYEINSHPNLNLDSIRLFLSKMDFDVNLKGTRIHARFDKERTVDLGVLCEKIELLFCLLPYMMDLDWITGSLILDKEAIGKAAAEWAKLFTDWGTLPLNYILSEDRRNILLNSGYLSKSSGKDFWDGNGEYNDCRTRIFNYEINASVSRFFDELGIELITNDNNKNGTIGQLDLEKKVFAKLNEGIESGEIIFTGTMFETAHPELFQRIHEAEFFADALGSNADSVKHFVLIAKLLILFERTLSFITTGYIENCEIQKAELPLLGRKLNVFVLRDYLGIIRLALVSEGNGIYTYRKYISDDWKNNLILNVNHLAIMLRQNNYVIPFKEPSAAELEKEIIQITESFFEINHRKRTKHFSDNIIVSGLKASPGKTVAKAVLGVESRNPEDFKNSILVTDKISPEDSAYIFNASGIISTSGGILSHAGIIANQFNKPAIIISGIWDYSKSGTRSLVYKTLKFKEEKDIRYGLNVLKRTQIREKENILNDEDIIILNGSEGAAVIFNKETVTCIYENLRKLAEAYSKLYLLEDSSEILQLRGKILKYKHSLIKEFSKIEQNNILRYAVYEILVSDTLLKSGFPAEEKSLLLNELISNPFCGNEALNYIAEITKAETAGLFCEAEEILNRFAGLETLPQILFARASFFRKYNFINGLTDIIPQKEDLPVFPAEKIKETEVLFSSGLIDLKSKIISQIDNTLAPKDFLKMRYILKQLNNIELMLGCSSLEAKELNEKFTLAEKEQKNIFTENLIITPECGGLEIKDFIGLKAANLAEIQKYFGPNITPDWFVITNKVFKDVLNTEISPALLSISQIDFKAGTVQNAIDLIIKDKGLSFKEKSLFISRLWESIILPPEVTLLIIDAYEDLLKRTRKEKDSEPYLAIRSSSDEEDSEFAAHAGEFETYLYVKGAEQIVKYLKKTWCGLWTERAIHNRQILGEAADYTNGGVIVQQMINSRISGVIQTMNTASGNPDEIIVNVGLGLGEGIVSGVVAADQITIIKDAGIENGDLKFNYLTGDKKEQMVFDSEKGFGVKLVETLYHQRFRAAIEYTELCDLCSLSLKLEQTFGYPLDIEFAFDEYEIKILQVRPIPLFFNTLTETVSQFPLNKIMEKKYDTP